MKLFETDIAALQSSVCCDIPWRYVDDDDDNVGRSFTCREQSSSQIVCRYRKHILSSLSSPGSSSSFDDDKWQRRKPLIIEDWWLEET